MILDNNTTINLITHNMQEEKYFWDGPKVILVTIAENKEKQNTIPKRVLEDVLHNELDIDYLEKHVKEDGTPEETFSSNMIFGKNWILSDDYTFEDEISKAHNEIEFCLENQEDIHAALYIKWDGKNNTYKVLKKELDNPLEVFKADLREYLDNLREINAKDESEHKVLLALSDIHQRHLNKTDLEKLVKELIDEIKKD